MSSTESSSGNKPAQDSDKAQTNTQWGGRFSESTDQFVQAFTASVQFDQRMYRQDIEGSRAHAAMLTRIGVLDEADLNAIRQGLDAIEKEIEAGNFEWSVALEDVHMNIEAALTARIGDAGKRLHTGRSRNDQVATDIRLYMRDACDAAAAECTRLLEGLLPLAQTHAGTIMPGFTHLQTAQPVTFGHHVMAWFEMLLRDLERLGDTRRRLNRMPLGAAALAGTSYPIDREITRELLQFDAVCENSLDAVSDRDFAIEFCSNTAICLMHLSRIAEELVLWMSAQFGFIDLPDRFCTGSSIMPQKKNPDAAELTRAKVGRILGSLVTLMTVMKGLPLAYSKDMQEDKEPVFDAADALALALAAMAGMVADMTPNTDRLREAAAQGFSTATDLADWLVRDLGMPFRDAHHVTGSLVKMAEDRGCDLDALSLADMQTVEPRITDAVFGVLSVEASVRSRVSHGGTAPVRVTESVKARRNGA